MAGHGGWCVNGRVVIADEVHGYLLGKVKECKGIGQEAELVVSFGNTIKKVRGSDAVAVEKGLELDKVDDLARLDALTEGVLVECLRARYAKDIIYTSIGGVLLALNPFRAIDGLYGPNEMESALLGNLSGQHPFAVAEAAARGLCLDGSSQSVLVSGESGAGKTETVKKVLRYLSYRSRHESPQTDSEKGIDELVVKTNPVLEAFCNAKTCRNENSSRFGKYIKVAMDPMRGAVVAASIASYLLEKVRVVHQLQGERNFHVFYQMVRAGAFGAKVSRSIDAYPNLVHGQASTIHGIDDAQIWHKETAPALAALGLGTDLVPLVMEAVLIIANLEFVPVMIEGEDEASKLKESTLAAAKRLGVDIQGLELGLTTRAVATVRAKNSVDTASRARDALAKSMYDKLVLRLVEAMNQVLNNENCNESNFPFVGLLDIFGFESLLTNSLEQILINLANERLQQHFNKIVFADEAKEYEREGVPVSATSFIDNTPVVSAIERSILRPLEDESQLKSGSDNGLVRKFLQNATKSQQSILFKPMLRTSSSLFGIRHFAGDVIYETQGLVAKNRDAVPEALVTLMANSDRAPLRELFYAAQPAEGTGARRGRANASRRLGVARSFSLSLSALAATLEATTPHFVRCVKTNSKSEPHLFQGSYVLTQLRYMGVLQIVEARKRGYARRLVHAAFKKRYYEAIVNGRFFTLDGNDDDDLTIRSSRRHFGDSDDEDCELTVSTTVSPQQMVGAVLDIVLGLPNDSVCLGKTKVYLKLVAYDALEKKRDAALRSAALRALAQAKTVIELEEALRMAVSDLRIRGPQVDEARARLADLRFFEAENKAVAALDADPRLNVSQLQERLDRVEDALTGLNSLDLAGSKEKGRRLAALNKRADTLRRRVAALAACARTAEQSIRRFSLEELECHAEALAACLEDLGHGLNEAPEAIKASKALEACNKAIVDLRGIAEDEEVKAEIKISTKTMPPPVPSASREAQEREDEALARRLQAEIDREQQSTRGRRTTAPSTMPNEEQEEKKEAKPQPLKWLDDRERAAAEEHADCAAGVIAAMNGSDDRQSRLHTGVCVVKFKLSVKTGVCSGAWKLLRVQSGKLTWTPLEVAEPGKSSSKKVFRRVVSKVRSDGAAGVPIKDIANVSLGPEQPRPAHSFVSAAHFVGSQTHGVPSRWAYITVSTRDRDYVFGFPKPAEDNAMSGGVIDPMLTEPLTWAASLERISDEARGAARALGEGCLARAQRVYLAELALLQEQDGVGSAPLARLCPVLRPLAHVMTQTLEAHSRTSLIIGASFGSRAPDRLVKASWLAAAILDAPLSRDFGAFIMPKKRALPPFRPGQLVIEPLSRVRDGSDTAVSVMNATKLSHHPVLEAVAAYAETNGLGPVLATSLTPSRQQPRTAAGRQASRTLRTAATRELPQAPSIAHVFAACAKLDADLVEALVLRARIRVNQRFEQIDSSTWRRIAGEELAFMEPQRFMTPLAYVVTWCDVLGDRADSLVRRLLLLRADATMDDGHLEVRFTPLASAVANGSLPIVRSLLHIGTDPDILTSDGRTPLHLLNLAPKAQRRALLELLLNAGATIDAKIPTTGDTPLHVAAKEGIIDVVSALIEFQANTLLTNLAGLTPSEAAFLELTLLNDDDSWTVSISEDTEPKPDKAESIVAKKKGITQCAHFLA